MTKIQKLPQDMINQIAAGEVIERPASIVKELIDNSIDAKATEIKVRLKNGGISLIEISDNGTGINKDDLKNAFEPHATSKISSFEDLNTLLTMGFRGEALSTIQSISEVTAVSKASDSDSAFKITYNKTSTGDVTTAAHNQGTTISVENIFYNVPARQKFLKTEETEYRKILEILTPYFLIHPEIHFSLEKDGKITFNLPKISEATASTIHPLRIKEVLKGDFTTDMVSFYYEGDGMKIGGLLAHPKYHAQKTSHIYVIVNNRPVSDSGIVKSVLQGLSRYIPHGEKVPFVINVTVNPNQVDVNVHPRKEEVRFINPYRVYSAVEQAVASALQREIKAENVNNLTEYTSSNSSDEIGYSRLRGGLLDEKPYSQTDYSRKGEQTYSGGALREISFKKRDRSNITDSIEFSKQMLQETDDEKAVSDLFSGQKTANEDESPINEIEAFNYYQIFNKYIIAEFHDQIWVIDQHAAAERVNFERLSRSIIDDTRNSQKLLVGSKVEISSQEISYISENKKFFEQLGFEFNINEDELEIIAVPTEVVGSDYTEVFKSLFELDQDSLDLSKNFEKAKTDMIATIACHSSVRKGQKLNPVEMKSILKDLMKCENPYSCPHGRPAIWKLKIEEIDKHFLRTY